MGRLNCAGETILDLYAGIGYYTLPFLCKAGEVVKPCLASIDCSAPFRLVTLLHLRQVVMSDNCMTIQAAGLVHDTSCADTQVLHRTFKA